MSLNLSKLNQLTVFIKAGFVINSSTEVDMPFNKENKPNQSIFYYLVYVLFKGYCIVVKRNSQE